VSLLRCLRANPLARCGLLLQFNGFESRRLRREQFLQAQEVVSGSLHGEGGLTTGSTRPLASISFMVNFSDHVEGCALAAGYPGR
jgi:hypothetical protein